MQFTKDDIVKTLISFFPQFTVKDINALYPYATYVNEMDKAVILDCNTQVKSIYLILKGAVRGYFFDHKGIERVIFFRSKGFFVADIGSVFFNKKPKYTFETIGETHLLRFNFPEFEELCAQQPKLMKIYNDALKEIIYTLNNRVERMISMTYEEQYLELQKNNPEFLEKASSKDVAKYLGITPVSLSRIKNRHNYNKR